MKLLMRTKMILWTMRHWKSCRKCKIPKKRAMSRLVLLTNQVNLTATDLGVPNRKSKLSERLLTKSKITASLISKLS